MAYQNGRFAFNDLYNQYSPALFGEILRIVKCEKAACMILKKTFLEIYYNRDSYNPEKIKIFTWMFTIARNNAKNHIADVKDDSSDAFHLPVAGSGFYHLIQLSQN